MEAVIVQRPLAERAVRRLPVPVCEVTKLNSLQPQARSRPYPLSPLPRVPAPPHRLGAPSPARHCTLLLRRRVSHALHAVHVFWWSLLSSAQIPVRYLPLPCPIHGRRSQMASPYKKSAPLSPHEPFL